MTRQQRIMALLILNIKSLQKDTVHQVAMTMKHPKAIVQVKTQHSQKKVLKNYSQVTRLQRVMITRCQLDMMHQKTQHFHRSCMKPQKLPIKTRKNRQLTTNLPWIPATHPLVRVIKNCICHDNPINIKRNQKRAIVPQQGTTIRHLMATMLLKILHFPRNHTPNWL